MFDEEKLRRHVRVREDIPVRWRVIRTGEEGEGVIRNLSISGALLETRLPASPGKCSEFQLESKVAEEASFVPREARLVWGRDTRTEKGYFLCGLEFVSPTPYNIRAIEKRVEDRLQGVTSGLNMGVLDRHFGLSG